MIRSDLKIGKEKILMGNFEKPHVACRKCLCRFCARNIATGKKEVTCSGCATCTGTLDDCPLDLFEEETNKAKKEGKR